MLYPFCYFSDRSTTNLVEFGEIDNLPQKGLSLLNLPLLENVIQGLGKILSGIIIHISKLINMGILRQMAEYLYLKKKNPTQLSTTWTRYMHGINRISILLFLVAMAILAYKLLFR